MRMRNLEGRSDARMMRVLALVFGLAFVGAAGCASPAEPTRDSGLCDGCDDASERDVAEDAVSDVAADAGKDATRMDAQPVDVLVDTAPESAADASQDAPVDVPAEPLFDAMVDISDVVDAPSLDVPTMDAPSVDAPPVDVPLEPAEDVSDVPSDVADAAPCPPSRSLCGGVCVDLQTSASNCGACGVACALVANATVTCVSGRCALACATGFGDCNRDGSDGCETDLRTTVSSCGACGNVCPGRDHATASCAAGVCGIVCAPTFGDCNGNAADGCEVNGYTDPMNCGGCGRACGATATCRLGSCVAVLNPPRAIAPMSTATVTSQRPTLRWQLASGTDGAEVELCRDRACTVGRMTIAGAGTSARPASPLEPGWWFWRLRGRGGTSVGTSVSPTWQFRVGVRSADGDRDTSWGNELDLNGDGFGDVAIGAPNASPGGRYDAGTARVFYGGSGGVATSAARVFEGGGSGDEFGFRVASVGDVNGDGYADLAIVAWQADVRAAFDDFGTVSIFHGGAAGVAMTPSTVLPGEADGDHFGMSFGALGDVNGDGYADIGVGTERRNAMGVVTAYTVSVYRGSATGISSAPAQVLEGEFSYLYQICSAGDVNGDGFADLVLGTAWGTRGRAYVFHGGALGIAPVAARVLEGGGAPDAFGMLATGVGDINGDGFADLAVAAHDAIVGDLYGAGTVSVFHGSSTGIPALPTRVLEGSTESGSFGEGLAEIGDLNRDGFADLVAASPVADPGGRNNAGMLSVFLGAVTGVSATPVRVIEGAAPGDLFGSRVAGAGDVNGDGYADVVVGVTHGLTGAAGSAFLFHGSAAGLPAMPSQTLGDGETGAAFGYSVARCDVPSKRCPFPQGRRRSSEFEHHARRREHREHVASNGSAIDARRVDAGFDAPNVDLALSATAS